MTEPFDFSKGQAITKMKLLEEQADRTPPVDEERQAAEAAQRELEATIEEEHREMESGRAPQLDLEQDNFMHFWHHTKALKGEAPRQQKEALVEHMTDTLRQLAGLPVRRRF